MVRQTDILCIYIDDIETYLTYMRNLLDHAKHTCVAQWNLTHVQFALFEFSASFLFCWSISKGKNVWNFSISRNEGAFSLADRGFFSITYSLGVLVTSKISS